MRRLLSKPIKLGRSRPTASMVVAVVALVFATTGGALASSSGPQAQAAKHHKSVAAQIKAYFKKHKASLTGPTGPQGATGPKGNPGATSVVGYTASSTASKGSVGSTTVSCPSGTTPTGGGVTDTTAGVYVDGSAPANYSVVFKLIVPIANDEVPTAWYGAVDNTTNSSSSFTVFVECASP